MPHSLNPVPDSSKSCSEVSVNSRRLDIVEDLDVEEVLSDLRKPQNREISDALECVQNALGGRAYVEDSYGRLLFVPGHSDPDDWRRDYTPLAAPASPKSAQVLEGWRHMASPYALLNGDQSLEFQRSIIPLVYKGTVFAFIHLVNSCLNSSLPARNSEKLTAAIADRIFMLAFATMNEYRLRDVKDCTPPQQAPSQVSARESEAAAMSKVHVLPTPAAHACIAISLPGGGEAASGEHVVIDYPSIVLRAGRILAEAVQCICPAITQLRPETVEREQGRIDLLIQVRMSGCLGLPVVASAIEHALKQLGWQLKVALGVLLCEEAEDRTTLEAGDYVAREAEVMLALASPPPVQNRRSSLEPTVRRIRCCG